MNQVLIILLIALLGPVIGSLLGILKKPSERFMYNMLSYAAGVMLAISFMELIPESIELSGIAFAVLGIFLGSGIMFILDKLIPHIHPELCSQEGDKKLKKTAVFLLIGIALHNFPEGIAMAVGTISDFNSLSLLLSLSPSMISQKESAQLLLTITVQKRS